VTVTRLLACVAILSVMVASPAVAQRIPEPLARLRPGATLRVERDSSQTLIGRLLSPIGDTLFLLAGEAHTGVFAASIAVLSERGNAWRKGAMIGGAVGGVGLFILAGELGGAINETGEFAPGAALVGAALGASGGGLLGGLIGFAIPEWHTRYRNDLP